jgi:cytochrome c oxidase subunit 3
MGSQASTPVVTAPHAAPGRQRPPLLIVGIFLFLGSELMFFASLFGTYFTLRAEAIVWPPPDIELVPLWRPTIFTAVLVASSLTMQTADRRIKQGNVASMKRWIWLTIVMGVVFLCGQFWDYLTANFGIETNAYGSAFYTLTGFHAMHVVAGLLVMLVGPRPRGHRRVRREGARRRRGGDVLLALRGRRVDRPVRRSLPPQMSGEPDPGTGRRRRVAAFLILFAVFMIPASLAILGGGAAGAGTPPVALSVARSDLEAAGQLLYEEHCSSCHGADATGHRAGAGHRRARPGVVRLHDVHGPHAAGAAGRPGRAQGADAEPGRDRGHHGVPRGPRAR